MLSQNRLRRALSRGALIAIVVVVIIIIAGGSYAAISLSSKATSTTSSTTSTTTSSTTSSSIVSTSSSSSSSSTTSSSTSSTTTSSSTVPPPSVVSTVPFTFCIVDPTTNIGAIPSWIVENQSLLQKYDPAATLSDSATESTTITSAIASGQCQVAVYAQSTMVSSVATGALNLTEVAVNQWPEIYQVIVGANTTYTSISQLKTATWDTTSFTILQEEIVWAQQGWSASSITQVASSSASASVSAVIAGKAVDMSGIGDNIVPLLAGQIRSVYNYTTPWPANVIVTTPAFAKADPTAVQAGVDAFLYAASILNTPSQASYIENLLLHNFPTYTPAEIAELISPSVSSFPSNGAISLGDLQQLINAMLTYGQISANITASTLVTTGYAPVGP